MRKIIPSNPVAAATAPVQAKSAGQLAYERDLARHPLYHNGRPRPQWAALWEFARWSWERNPSDPAYA